MKNVFFFSCDTKQEKIFSSSVPKYISCQARALFVCGNKHTGTFSISPRRGAAVSGTNLKKTKKHCCKRSALPIYTPSFFHFFYFFAPCRLTTDFGRIFTAPTWVCDAIVAPAVATFLPLLLVWTSRAAISFSQWSLACRYSIIVVLASSTDECSPSVQQDFGKNK